MKRSPGPTPSSPLTTISARSESASSPLDPALHPLGEDIARALHARQVDEDELATGLEVGGDAADRPPRRLRPHRDDRHPRADDRVDQRRLADVGTAGESDEAGPRHRRPSITRVLEREHLAASVSWSKPQRCRDSVDRRLGYLRAVRLADHHVTQLARTGAWADSVDGEGEDIGGGVLCRGARGSARACGPRRPARPRGARRLTPAAASAAATAVRRFAGTSERSTVVTASGATRARRAPRRPRRCAAPACGGPRPRRRSGRRRCPGPRRGCRAPRSGRSADRSAGRSG